MGSVGQEDMPRLFQETCRKQADYVGQLNPEPGAGYHESVLEESIPGEPRCGDLPVSGTGGGTG